MQLLRNPTLQSMLMVEEVIEKNSGETPYKIWKKLPRKMSYQAFQSIISYLRESSRKVAIDQSGHLVWIRDNRERVQYYLANNELKAQH